MFGFDKKGPKFVYEHTGQPLYSFVRPQVICKICGCKFNALTEKHYISRDNGPVGMAVAFESAPEVKTYDTYDCPQCGSQCVVQERKRMATTPEKEGMK